jgi:hypothetical protein
MQRVRPMGVVLALITVGTASAGGLRRLEAVALCAGGGHELVASFENLSNLLTYEEKQSSRTSQAPPERTSKKGCDYPHSRHTSVLECHTFF